MAAFPALEPDDRTFTQGVIPWAGTTAISGAEIRFKDANVPTQHRLELGYSHRTRTELDLLLAHYRTQNGSTFPFALSAQVLAGFGAETIVPPSLGWRYAGAPSVQTAGVLHNFTVTLEANG
jgi:hypothetical protein